MRCCCCCSSSSLSSSSLSPSAASTAASSAISSCRQMRARSGTPSPPGPSRSRSRSLPAAQRARAVIEAAQFVPAVAAPPLVLVPVPKSALTLQALTGQIALPADGLRTKAPGALAAAPAAPPPKARAPRLDRPPPKARGSIVSELPRLGLVPWALTRAPEKMHEPVAPSDRPVPLDCPDCTQDPLGLGANRAASCPAVPDLRPDLHAWRLPPWRGPFQ